MMSKWKTRRQILSEATSSPRTPKDQPSLSLVRARRPVPQSRPVGSRPGRGGRASPESGLARPPRPGRPAASRHTRRFRDSALTPPRQGPRFRRARLSGRRALTAQSERACPPRHGHRVRSCASRGTSASRGMRGLRLRTCCRIRCRCRRYALGASRGGPFQCARLVGSDGRRVVGPAYPDEWYVWSRRCRLGRRRAQPTSAEPGRAHLRSWRGGASGSPTHFGRRRAGVSRHACGRYAAV